MIGRYPDFDVLDAVDTWDEATQEGRARPARAARAAALLHRRGGADAARVLRHRAGPGRRAAGAGGRDGRREAGRRQARRLPATPTCPTTATPGGSVLRGLDHTAQRGVPVPRSPTAPTSSGRTSSREFAAGRLVGGPWDELNVDAGVVGGDARRAGAVLLPPVGVERDRLRRPGLPARVHAAGRPGATRAGSRSRSPGAVAADPVREDEAGQR